MVDKGFEPENLRTLFFSKQISCCFFLLSLTRQKPPLILRIKKTLGLVGNEEVRSQVYLDSLREIRDDFPFKLSFWLAPWKIGDKSGILINIRSEPTKLFKVKSLGLKPFPDELLYSIIISTNKYFVEEIIHALGAIVVEEPTSIGEYIRTPTMDKLEKFGFNKTFELLRRGKNKIERGDTEDGLTDLREALNKFISEMVKRKGSKPTKQLPKDLKTLYEMKLINKTMYTVIRRFIYDWIYAYLSAKPVHQRERINYDDANFLFSISEEIMSYLIDKIMLGR